MNEFLQTQILTEPEDAVGEANCSVSEIDKVIHSVDYFRLSRMWADRGARTYPFSLGLAESMVGKREL